MTKILIIAPDFYPTNGGYANAITNLVKKMSEDKKIKIIIFTHIENNNKEIFENNVSVIRFNLHKILKATKIWEVISFFKIKKILKEKKIDIVFFETGEFGLLGFLLTFIKKNIIIRIHATTETEIAIWSTRLYDRFNSFFTKLFLKRSRWILSTSKYHLDFYKKYFLKDNIIKISQKNYFILPNIIEKEKVFLNKDDLLKKYNICLADNEKIIFSLGRLNFSGMLQKGFEDLVYAIYFLKQKDAEIVKKVKIIIVGDGECRSYIKNIINKLNLQDNFYLIKKMEHNDVLSLMSVSSAVVLLSRFEGLSMFAIEALSVGSPLIFSKNGGIVDLVSKDNGYLVEAQSIEEINDALEKAINKTEAEIEIMREFSKKLFNEKYHSNKIADKFKNIISLIEKSN